MLKNPKTTIYGYLVLGTMAGWAGWKMWHGQAPDFMQIIAALTGLGLIGASDGGH